VVQHPAVYRDGQAGVLACGHRPSPACEILINDFGAGGIDLEQQLSQPFLDQSVRVARRRRRLPARVRFQMLKALPKRPERSHLRLQSSADARYPHPLSSVYSGRVTWIGAARLRCCKVPSSCLDPLTQTPCGFAVRLRAEYLLKPADPPGNGLHSLWFVCFAASSRRRNRVSRSSNSNAFAAWCRTQSAARTRLDAGAR